MGKVYAVILAGGSGTRFWPKSRAKRPKQFLKLTKDSSMIKDTIRRISKIIPKKQIYISLGKNLHTQFKRHISWKNYIIEPMARNTAPAIGLAALTLYMKDPEAIMFIETSDHIYNNEKKYFTHLKAAFKTAEEGKIVQIGIKPLSPYTGYGYIKQGRLYSKKGNVKIYHIDSFKEKPTKSVAKRYFNSSEYTWNSGMFIAKCSVMLEEIRRYMPKLHKALVAIAKSNFNKKVTEREFKKLESVSIDYGIIEKTKKSVVVRGEFHWDDIGDWLALDRIMKKDSDGNILKGDILSVDTKDCIIEGNRRLIAAVGLKDLVIIGDRDCTLICSKEEIGKLKQLIKELKKRNKRLL